MGQNPWAVESIQDFYFLKCPECDFDTKKENSFETHATENHPLSLVLFGKKSINEDFDTIDIKEEPLSHFDTENSYDDQKSSTHNLFSQLSPITEDNFRLVVPELKKELTDKSYMNNSELSDLESGINNNEHSDIAAPSEIQESDKLMAITEPLQMLKSVKNRLTSNRNDSRLKRKSEKHSQKAIKKIKTRQKPLKACEATFICAQPKMKKEKMEHKKANNKSENNNVPIDKKSQFRHIFCPICNKKFSDRPGLNRHSRIVHDKIKIAKCHLCSQEFNTECSKKRHIESVHEGKIYGCDKCEKEFSYSASLLKHKKKHHNSNEDLST